MKINKNKLYEIMGLIKYLTECRCSDSVYTEDFLRHLDYYFGIEVSDELPLGNTKIIISPWGINKTHWIEITLYLDVIISTKFKLTDYIVDIKKRSK